LTELSKRFLITVSKQSALRKGVANNGQEKSKESKEDSDTQEGGEEEEALGLLSNTKYYSTRASLFYGALSIPKNVCIPNNYLLLYVPSVEK
jgi:hypothetical protein